MKKTLALILTLVMLLSCLSVTAFAAAFDEGYLGTWTGVLYDDDDHQLANATLKVEESTCTLTVEGEPNPFTAPYDGDNLFWGDSLYIEVGLLSENEETGETTIQVTGYYGESEISFGGSSMLTKQTSGGDNEEESKSGNTTITATKAAPFSYEISIPSNVPEITAAGVYEVGEAKVTNVVSATDNTVISYTATTTDFKLSTDNTKTMDATYYTEQAAENTFPTDAVKVYENKADAASIPTMYVKIADADWNAAAAGTYHASVTFNFSAEEEEAIPMRRVYVGSMTTFAPICNDPATNLKVRYVGEDLDGLADLTPTGKTAIYDIHSLFNYCTDPMTFDVYYADIPEAATTYHTKDVTYGSDSESEDELNTADANGKILLVWDQVGGHRNHLFEYNPAD